MSDDVLTLIPTDPRFVPDERSAARAAACLRRLVPDGESCQAQRHQRTVFVDNGANTTAAICPACTRRIELDGSAEATAWWQAATDFDDEADLADVQVVARCCGARVAFAAVRYDWPAGCARFVLSIRNPGLPRPLPAAAIDELAGILGCELLEIRAHY